MATRRAKTAQISTNEVPPRQPYTTPSHHALTLPYPPSANRYWRVVKGRPIVSAEARAYKKLVALKHSQLKPLTGDVLVTLRVYRPRKAGDLDNSIKVTLDALRGVAFVDDSQVADLLAHRLDDKSNPRVEVIVAKAAS